MCLALPANTAQLVQPNIAGRLRGLPARTCGERIPGFTSPVGRITPPFHGTAGVVTGAQVLPAGFDS